MPQDEPVILKVEHLSHSYGDVHAVRDISFTVKKGEIFSFLGPNGAGKSTAINVLITLLPLQHGEVSVAGFNLRTEREQVRKSIGIVFQEITLDRDMTVSETLEFHGDIYGLDSNLCRDRTRELLELVKLEDKVSAYIKELSGGMKRRLEIARGLMTRPKLLFLDEPTIGLDPQTRRKTWEYLRSVNAEGTTIFLTTHYMDEADELSDQIAIIDHGKIIATGTPASLKNSLGEDIIYLETTDNPAAIKVLMTIPGVKKVQSSGSRITLLSGTDGTHLLPRIIETLTGHSISVQAVNLKKPNMDDVFIHYTGRELRD
ncbi:MAG TPA: ATP-binding cassette domain-containing protein [Methanospirillum sp.]|jgi:ABC-2 type transport system ATP-binding protein|uniref:ABC transporter ATP-binding protein n=1 Tax=Methanospirillum sp. TaxID=45200 RepID=UPI001BD4C34B|nr:ATP-binding cassette domain-containing protein [Methanospirillum sp.]HPY60510.1 ATP-binding cassette domain-containing protein [Methanospirillum sp.]HQB99237.1 ATP-binding cassette domain-containing protein [Methanospirillum sp.]